MGNAKSIAIGGDIDTTLANTLTQNLTSLHSCSLRIAEGIFWSAQSLPVRTAAIDVVILDFPFGKVASTIPKLFRVKIPKVVEEIARILRPGGRTVILIQSYQHLLACLDSVYFSCQETSVRGVNIGGYVCVIITAVRSSVEFRQPLPRSDTWDTHSGSSDTIATSLLSKRKISTEK